MINNSRVKAKNMMNDILHFLQKNVLKFINLTFFHSLLITWEQAVSCPG